MDSVVIYQSKYGSAEQYAGWIAEELGCAIYRAEEFEPAAFERYGAVIYCGSVYAGSILGFRLIAKNFAALRDKHVVVAAVGSAGQSDEAVDEVKVNNFTKEMKRSENIDVFLLRGALDYDRMSFLHRRLMKVVFNAEKKKGIKNAGSGQANTTFAEGSRLDLMDRASIGPLLARVRQFEA